MTGLESIIKQIEEEASINAKETIKEAEMNVAQIREDAKLCALKIKEEGRKERETILMQNKKQSDSASSVLKKNKILERKQQMIKETMDEAINQVLSLPEEEYFELILEMLASLKLGHGGSLHFNDRDLHRLPKEFVTALEDRNERRKECQITISKEPVVILGGFLLEQGSVIQNLSIEELFEVKKDQLLEPVATLLFANEA